MQTAQIREKFVNVDQCIKDAARAGQMSNAAPQELKNCLQQLNSESDQTTQMLRSQSNDQQIAECIDRMEELGDRAMQACKQGGNIDQQLQSAVMQAHDAISSLKHQLH